MAETEFSPAEEFKHPCRCWGCNALTGMEQSRQIYFYLQRVSMFLETKIHEINEVIKNIESCLYRAKDITHFRSKGQIYLDMANVLHEHHQETSAMFTIMLRAMDIYSKLKLQLRVNQLQICWSREGRESPSEREDRLKRRDEEIICACKEFSLDILYNILYNVDEPNYNPDLMCFYREVWEISHRAYLLANIKSLITRIKNLWVVFTESSAILDKIISHAR